METLKVTPNLPLTDLASNLSVRGENCMRALMAETNVMILRDLCRFTESDLLKRKHWGKIQLREVKDFMAKAGLYLALDRPVLVDNGGSVSSERPGEGAQQELVVEVERLKKLIALDRTGLAAALNRVRTLIRAWEWVGLGEWGSYSYEDHTAETLRREWQEFEGTALAVIVEALRASGQRADAAFHLTTQPPAEELSEREKALLRALRLYFRGYVEKPYECSEGDFESHRMTPQAHRAASDLLTYYERHHPKEYAEAVRGKER